MKLWLLERENYQYDEYFEKIIRAKTEEDARSIANQSVGREGKIWDNRDLVSCKELSISGEPELIIASFHAS